MAWKEMMRWTRPKSEVSVEITDPHHVYKPGETISGTVLIDLGSRAPKAGVFVLFKGALRLKAARPHVKVQESVIFDEDVQLCSGQDLEQGKHSFPFELQLPSENLLESMDFDLGSILYTIKARIEAAGSACRHSQQRLVKVSATRDVAQLNQHKNVSLVVNVSKRKKPKQVTLKLMIPRRGWLPGEDIPVKLLVEHQWAVHGTSSIALTLSRISHFVVGDSEYTYRKDLCQSLLSLYTDDASRSAELSTTLKVPPESLISASTKFITFSYLVEVTADISGKIDLHNWANSNPAIKIIDTDRVRSRPGVVSAWAEIVVGSFRSHEESSSRPGTVSDVVHANLSPPSSLASSEHTGESIGLNGTAPNGTVLNGTAAPVLPSDISAAGEKKILAARARTLIPSAPSYPEQQEPLAPSAPAPSSALNKENGGDEKNALRLRQLASDPAPDYGGAPAYTPEGVNGLVASAPMAPMPMAPSAPSPQD